jgi:hypothetical protein
MDILASAEPLFYFSLGNRSFRLCPLDTPVNFFNYIEMILDVFVSAVIR